MLEFGPFKNMSLANYLKYEAKISQICMYGQIKDI